MFKGLLTSLFVLLAGAAQAQDITIPMRSIGAESQITIQTNTGQAFTYRMLGEVQAGVFAYEMYSGFHPAGNLIRVYYSDQHGNLFRSVEASGAQTTWSPHRCNRTLGACNYTEVRADGLQLPFTRVTQAIQGGFTYQLINGAGVTTLTGRAILNELGWTQWGSSQARNQPQVDIEILSAHYR